MKQEAEKAAAEAGRQKQEADQARAAALAQQQAAEAEAQKAAGERAAAQAAAEQASRDRAAAQADAEKARQAAAQAEAEKGQLRPQLLAQNGVPASSITARGFGKTQPVASNGTADGRQRNRRVELVVNGDAIGGTANASASNAPGSQR